MVRHPLYVGWPLMFWAEPVMTVAHLVFTLGTTAYIFIAIQFEERDLIRSHKEYADYRRRRLRSHAHYREERLGAQASQNIGCTKPDNSSMPAPISSSS